jgi:hypothetical protein
VIISFSLLRVAAATIALTTAITAQTNFELRDIGPGRGKVILGEGGIASTPPFDVSDGSLGESMAWADLNGDGADDLILGAPTLTFFPVSASEDNSGHVYVIFGDVSNGNPASPADLDLVTDTCSTVLNLVGTPNDRLGASVCAAGDLNNDGFEDALIGAPGLDALGRTACGGAYILWGAADLADLPGSVGQPLCLIPIQNLLGAETTLLVGADSFAAAGMSVAGDVDSDGDGISDVVVGAPLQSVAPLSQNGTATVVYGAPGLQGSFTVDLGALGSGAATTISGADDFQLLGSALAGLGSFDATLPDGLGQDLVNGDDIAIGAPGTFGTGFFSGAVYVLRGRASGTPPTSYDTDDFGNGVGTAGLVWFGENTGDQFGSSVNSAGDLVGANGFVELVCGAPFQDPLGRTDAGSLYVLAGRLGSTDPVGFNVDQIGSGAMGLRIAGAAASAGLQGLSSCTAGDFNGDGQADLAVGFPALTVLSGLTTIPQAGAVDILDGSGLGIPAVTEVDMAVSGVSLSLMRLTGDAVGARAGTDLRAGDFNGDGQLDLALGASGAPSDPDPADFSGLAFTETGRGHVLFGPLLRVSTLTPVVSHFEGPTITLSIDNLTDASGLDIQLGGVSSVLDQVVLGTPGSVVFQPPLPAVPGAAVDLTVVLPGESVLLADVITYTALAIDSGPVPNPAVPGGLLTFTGQAFSSAADMSVTLGGFAATISSVDPLNGDLVVVAPAGLPAFVDQDISIVSSNGSVLLTDAISYEPFVVTDITPLSGPQDAGVFDAFQSFPGTPDVPVTLTIPTTSGTIPSEVVVEFGSDDKIWRAAEVVSSVGDQLVVNLPHYYLFDETLVDVRVTTDDHQQLLEDAFTYTASDFEEFFDTATPAFGTAPRVLAAGEFIPSNTLLFILDNYSPQTKVINVLIGIDQLLPPMPLKGGLLGTTPLSFSFAFPAPIGGSVSLPAVTDSLLAGSEGITLYLQLGTVEKIGPNTLIGFSNLLGVTVRVP